MDSNKVSFDFAKAWDANQGNFAESIAENIIRYAENNNVRLSSVLDICCGASNLLGVFNRKGMTCFGTETKKSMIDYSMVKHPDVTYYQTENMCDVTCKQKVDLITCTHDVVNCFENFSEWEEFFKNAEKKLNKNGIFIFDFYTKYKLKNWNETTFTTTPTLDCLMSVKSGVYDKTILTYTYFINYTNYYVKTKDIIVESYYENNAIFEALKKAGFKSIEIVNHNLSPLDNIDYAERIHIIARKK